MIEDTTQHMQYTTYFKLNMTRNRYSCSSRFFFHRYYSHIRCMCLNLNHWTVQSIPLYRSYCVVHFTLRCFWIALLYQFLRVPNQLYWALYNIHQVHKSISRYNEKNAILRSWFWVRNRVAHNRRVYRCLFLSHI